MDEDFFHRDRILLIDMGAEGIQHANISDLFTILFYIWFSQRREQIFSSLLLTGKRPV